MPGKYTLDSAEKQRRTDRLKPYRFKKGQSGNPNGRPKSFDQLRNLAQQIAHEVVELKDGSKITVADAVLRAWANSSEPTLQKAFMEYAFGKVPDKLETDMPLAPIVIMRHAHESNGINGNGNGARKK